MNTQWHALSRDPFARTETMRRRAGSAGEKASCDWCGQKALLYEYGTQSDSNGRVNEWRGFFCNIACAYAYHS